MQFDTQTSSMAKFIIFDKTIFVTGFNVIFYFISILYPNFYPFGNERCCSKREEV